MTAPKAIVTFLVGRPLIAIAIAAVVVGVLLYVETHRQKTPVTHRSQRVALTDEQQMQLGARDYADTLRQNRSRIISAGPSTALCSASRSASRPLPAATSPPSSGK